MEISTLSLGQLKFLGKWRKINELLRVVYRVEKALQSKKKSCGVL